MLKTNTSVRRTHAHTLMREVRAPCLKSFPHTPSHLKFHRFQIHGGARAVFLRFRGALFSLRHPRLSLRLRLRHLHCHFLRHCRRHFCRYQLCRLRVRFEWRWRWRRRRRRSRGKWWRKWTEIKFEGNSDSRRKRRQGVAVQFRR